MFISIFVSFDSKNCTSDSLRQHNIGDFRLTVPATVAYVTSLSCVIETNANDSTPDCSLSYNKIK